MIDIFHPDYMLKKLDEALERSREEWERFTPEERLQYFKRLGWAGENGKATPEFEVIRRLMFQFD
ncbi:hypothetical protein [Chitinophaga sp.]|uniref:hypothetical protein n=1 Tax=Chitinophaga sp. TaxID=1869181 RepID=UPI0031D2FFD3